MITTLPPVVFLPAKEGFQHSKVGRLGGVLLVKEQRIVLPQGPSEPGVGVREAPKGHSVAAWHRDAHTHNPTIDGLLDIEAPRYSPRYVLDTHVHLANVDEKSKGREPPHVGGDVRVGRSVVGDFVNVEAPT